MPKTTCARLTVNRRRLRAVFHEQGKKFNAADKAIGAKPGTVSGLLSEKKPKQGTLPEEQAEKLIVFLDGNDSWLNTARSAAPAPVSNGGTVEGQTISWFCDFIKGRTPDEIARMKGTLSAAFPSRAG